ncbi:barstar family protein [Streptomyces sp. NPDC001492]
MDRGPEWAARLGSPDWFGHHWDAFLDCHRPESGEGSARHGTWPDIARGRRFRLCPVWHGA